MARAFYSVYIADPFLQSAIDVLRFVANPAEKWPAHITVRGPYDSEEDPHLRVQDLALEGALVHIQGVNNFFEHRQNTVFLPCDSDALRKVWDKSDFGYNPHITLYDGPSRQFARRLFDLLNTHPLRASFQSTALARMVSIKGSKDNLLRRTIEATRVGWILTGKLTTKDIIALNGNERLDLIESIWAQLISKYHDGNPGRHQQLLSFADTPPRALESLQAIATRAYVESHGNASIDWVIADPARNAAFVQRCWELGAYASEYELNRALLRARKAGRVGAIPTVRRHAVTRGSIDEYIWAVEIALRMVQDEERYERDRYVSVDRILCEPSLSHRLDILSRHLAPGHDAADYRWASLLLRKGYNASSSPARIFPTFERLRTIDMDASNGLDGARGLVWAGRRSRNLFVGATNDVARMIRVLRSLTVREMPLLRTPALRDLRDADFAVAVSRESVSACEATKSGIVRTVKPELNILFDAAA